jgi:hypothetical protein
MSRLTISTTISLVLMLASCGSPTRAQRSMDGCALLPPRRRHAYRKLDFIRCVAKTIIIMALVRVSTPVLAEITNGVPNKTEKINAVDIIWRIRVMMDTFINTETMPRRVAERKGMTVAHAMRGEFAITNR